MKTRQSGVMACTDYEGSQPVCAFADRHKIDVQMGTVCNAHGFANADRGDR